MQVQLLPISASPASKKPAAPSPRILFGVLHRAIYMTYHSMTHYALACLASASHLCQLHTLLFHAAVILYGGFAHM